MVRPSHRRHLRVDTGNLPEIPIMTETPRLRLTLRPLEQTTSASTRASSPGPLARDDARSPAALITEDDLVH